MSFTRTLTFRANDLGKTSALVLTFDDNATPGIFKDVFPTAFKVSSFKAKGPYVFTVTYKADLGFTRAQVSGGTVEPASTYTPIQVGQETTLTKEGSPPTYSFSDPNIIEPPTTQMIAMNGTNGLEDIGIGFFERPDREPTQMLVFKDVGTESRVQAEFTPILRAYVTSDYQQNALLKGQISTKPLFKEDLVMLREHTNWLLKYNPGSGKYEIIADTSRA